MPQKVFFDAPKIPFFLFSHYLRTNFFYIIMILNTLHKKTIYRLTLSDDSRLVKIAECRIPLWKAICLAFMILMIMIFLSSLIIIYTPLRRLLPGYMEDSRRYETIDGLMRLDSLQNLYDVNQRYINNIITVLDTDRIPADSIQITPNENPMTIDSLVPRSKNEDRFIKMMEEREKYNISILAPLAADGMIFNPVSNTAVITENSRNENVARYIVPSGEPISVIADGRVIDIQYSHKEGGYSVIVQHGKGFVSRYSHLGSILCEKGDLLSAGQIIAFPHQGKGRNGHFVTLEMWRNGSPLIPCSMLAPMDSPRRDDASSADS